MKRTGWIVLVLILVLAGGYLVFRWQQRSQKDPEATFIKPRIEMVGMQILHIDKDYTKGNMKILIDNPAPVGFEADSLAYQLYIAGVKVVQSSYPKHVDINSNDSSLIILPVTIKNEELIQTLKQLEQKGLDSTEYTAKANIYTDLPFLKKKPVELEVSKKLPLLRLPELKLVDADLDKLGFKQTKYSVRTEITNKNVFSFVLHNARFQVNLNGEKFTEGTMPEVVNIPAKGKATIEVPMSIKPNQLMETGIDLLKKDKKNTYLFVFEANLVDKEDNKMFDNSKLKMESSGDLRELIKNTREVIKENKKK
ncbi:LEA type 2 family protein [Cytophagaceae bacterium DM2B3-1]|uniref:LEA type 2 family protein n=1 Tax=Xanthocytophaga flava TaxID=3048013 RepID=A0ABT7CIG0_9BACT|nr:LEA type 2 family protein [Xanthocytophaga flavus]MDJ1493516.1 LEA type 2 family protein [Xanthocytophaga flavus]